MNTVKTAIAIPRNDFRLIEKFRRKLRKTRSQLLVEAFRSWVADRHKKEMDDRYAEAYRQQPEDATELEAFQKASLAAWPKEDW